MQCEVLKYEDKGGEEEREHLLDRSKAMVSYEYCNFK